LKKLLSILFFSIFLFAQFGKVISYAYCKWEKRTEVHCDCEKILLYANHQDDEQLAKLNINVKWEEPIIADRDEMSIIGTNDLLNHTSAYFQDLTNGYAVLPFHPPAIV